MAIRVAKFEVGKGTTLDNLNRELTELALRASNVLNVSVASVGQDRLELVLTYDDTTAPFILATIPSDGQNIAPGGEVTAIFSEAIQNVTTADLTVFNVTDNVTVSSSEYTINNSQAAQAKGVVRIIDSGDFLEDRKVYRYSFLATIKDLAGNTMEEAYDLILTVNRSIAELTFDGGRVSSFTNPSVGRWETTVTPTRLTFDIDTSLVDLTLRSDEDQEFRGFTPHYEALISPSGSIRIVLEATGILLPNGAECDWKITNGLG